MLIFCDAVKKNCLANCDAMLLIFRPAYIRNALVVKQSYILAYLLTYTHLLRSKCLSIHTHWLTDILA